jgi:hypothetical protein
MGHYECDVVTCCRIACYVRCEYDGQIRRICSLVKKRVEKQNQKMKLKDDNRHAGKMDITKQRRIYVKIENKKKLP